MNKSQAIHIAPWVGTVLTLLATLIPAVGLPAQTAVIIVTVLHAIGAAAGYLQNGNGTPPLGSGTATLLFISLLIACGANTACSTTPSTTPIADRVAQIAAQEPADIAAVLQPILKKNPKYAPDVLLLGQILPSLLANGPITPQSYTSAVASIPGISAQEQTDLSIGGLALTGVLGLYEALSGNTVALYTDANVAVIVNGFAAGLVAAGQAAPSVPSN